MPMYATESAGSEGQNFGMDTAAEDSFCRFVERMPPRAEGTVRLFNRGDYFSAHGPDALLVAHDVFFTNNVIKYLGSSSRSAAAMAASSAASTSKVPSAMTARGLPSVTIRPNLAKLFLRECLTAKQMRVEIYEPEDGAGGKKNNAKWILAKAASPGNITQVEDLLFDNEDFVGHAVSMALKVSVKEGSRVIGAAFIDTQERMLGVAEYVDDDLYGNTESLLIQLQVKECLLPSDEKQSDHELTKLRTLVERCGIVITERRPADFSAKNIEQDLSRLLDANHSSTIPELDMKQAMSSLAALLVFTNLLALDQYTHQFRLYRHDLSQYMKLDASALKALNLMPSPQDIGGGKNMSLYGLLNRCKTSQGQRLLARWLKQPLVNLHEIKKRQGVVEAFVEDLMTRTTLQSDILKRMPDLHRLSKKFHRGIASLQDVIVVYQSVKMIPMMISCLEKINASSTNKQLIEDMFLEALRTHQTVLQAYVDMVEDTIDLDQLEHHNYVLRPELDADLTSLKEDLERITDGMDAEHLRVASDLGLEIDKKLLLENHPVYRYSLRITKAEAGLLRVKKGYTDLATQKSGSIFTTARLRELSDNYFDAMREYERKQNKLVKEIVGIAATYIPVLEQLDNLIAAVDVCASLAHVSANARIPYVRPVLTEKGTGDILVRGARHPCLEVQDDIEFIPNDHDMRKGESEFIILTGPNMGGKSTYIRQIGVIALMAQVGCFVPADEAQLPVFDCILARVGAGDSTIKGVSTFMAEMLETATILKSATKDSLIIIDELGRGTSTYDGFGLAWAISEHISSKIHCFCLFATHFHELTTLDQSQSHVKNLHVEAYVQPKRGASSKQEQDITLLYKVVEGVCDQSFGIHVAELAQFPESVVNLAKRKAEELEDFGDGNAGAGPFAQHTQQETDEGTALVKAFLDEWRSRIEQTGGGVENGLSEEQQVEELQKVAAEYKERFEGNPWVMTVLESF